MHILSQETDNCSSWISGRERMTVVNISWSIKNFAGPGGDGTSSWTHIRLSQRGRQRLLLLWLALYPFCPVHQTCFHKQCRSRWDVLKWTVSSGSALFPFFLDWMIWPHVCVVWLHVVRFGARYNSHEFSRIYVWKINLEKYITTIYRLSVITDNDQS